MPRGLFSSDVVSHELGNDNVIVNAAPPRGLCCSEHAERRMEEKEKKRRAGGGSWMDLQRILGGGLSVMVVVLPCDERLKVLQPTAQNRCHSVPARSWNAS